MRGCNITHKLANSTHCFSFSFLLALGVAYTANSLLVIPSKSISTFIYVRHKWNILTKNTHTHIYMCVFFFFTPLWIAVRPVLVHYLQNNREKTMAGSKDFKIWQIMPVWKYDLIKENVSAGMTHFVKCIVAMWRANLSTLVVWATMIQEVSPK